MYLYVELWNARPEWLALSGEEKQAYLKQVGTGIQTLTDAGVELVGFALNEEETPYRAAYRYLAAWKMPGKEQIILLENILEQARWHDYFDQVNARGELLAPEAALADMASLAPAQTE